MMEVNRQPKDSLPKKCEIFHSITLSYLEIFVSNAAQGIGGFGEVFFWSKWSSDLRTSRALKFYVALGLSS